MVMLKPGPYVKQEFVSASPIVIPPDLPAFIVGPNYQIVEDQEAGVYDGTLTSYAYPTIETAAVIDAVSIIAKLTDAYLKISFGTGATYASDVMTKTGAFVDALVNDIVYIGSGITMITAKILELTSDDDVKLDKNIPSGASSDFVVARAVTIDTDVSDKVTDVDTATFSLPANILINTKPVYVATVMISFRALRQALVGKTTEITDATQIEAICNKVAKENPLALGAFLAKINTVTSINVIAIDEDNALGYLKALDVLENEKAYSIVLLSQDPTIQGMVKAHVDGMSMPEKGRWRRAYINLEHPWEGIIVQTTTQATIKAVDDSGIISTLDDVNASFSGQVLLGDYIFVTENSETSDPDNLGIFKVISVYNNSTIVLENQKYTQSKAGSGVFTAGDEITAEFEDIGDYKVIRVLDKNGQAEALGEIASSYGDRRITYITNAEVAIDNLSTGTTEILPGYYLGCVYAGLRAGNPPHQGFTNYGILGVKEVRYANLYFNDTQLATIAEKGGWIVVQDIPGVSLPYAWIQTTTDTSSVEKREESFSVDLDYMSYLIRDSLNKYIGIYNIYPGTMGAITNTINADLSFALGQSFDKIGPIIQGGSLDSLIVDPLMKDTLRAVVSLAIPLPLNYIWVTIQV